MNATQQPSNSLSRPKWYTKAKERIGLMKRFATGTDVHLLEMACKDYDDLRRELDTAMLGLAAIREQERASHEPFDALRQTLCAVGIVGNIDGHDVIRRDSVIELIDRARGSSQPPRPGEFAIGESVRVGPFHNGEYSKVMKITGAQYFCDNEFGPYSPSVIVRATATKGVG